MTHTPPIPVTIIGGYLGAGKTTLVNHLLRNADGVRLAVLVNDFGELPIDADLIVSRDGNVTTLAGGCVCCSFGSDLASTLVQVAAQAPDHILIEASGIALPGPVAATVALLSGFTANGVVVLADAETVCQRSADRFTGDTITRQLASAHIVAVNKADMVDQKRLAAAVECVRRHAPRARIITVRHAQLPLSVALEAGPSIATSRFVENHDHGGHRSVSVVLPGPVDLARLQQVLCAAPFGLLRAKGFVETANGATYLLQLVGWHCDITQLPTTVPQRHGLVCIGPASSLDPDRLTAAILSTLVSCSRTDACFP